MADDGQVTEEAGDRKAVQRAQTETAPAVMVDCSIARWSSSVRRWPSTAGHSSQVKPTLLNSCSIVSRRSQANGRLMTRHLTGWSLAKTESTRPSPTNCGATRASCLRGRGGRARRSARAVAPHGALPCLRRPGGAPRWRSPFGPVLQEISLAVPATPGARLTTAASPNVDAKPAAKASWPASRRPTAPPNARIRSAAQKPPCAVATSRSPWCFAPAARTVPPSTVARATSYPPSGCQTQRALKVYFKLSDFFVQTIR